MKALNKESILYCDELETELHDAEMMQLDEQNIFDAQLSM